MNDFILLLDYFSCWIYSSETEYNLAITRSSILLYYTLCGNDKRPDKELAKWEYSVGIFEYNRVLEKFDYIY